MTTAFLSSPLAHESPAVIEDRARVAGEAWAWLTCYGYAPFAPAVRRRRQAIRYGMPMNAMAWADVNRARFNECGCLVVLRLIGWQDSQGVAMEMKWAQGAGKPILFMDVQNAGFSLVEGACQ